MLSQERVISEANAVMKKLGSPDMLTQKAHRQQGVAQGNTCVGAGGALIPSHVLLAILHGLFKLSSSLPWPLPLP